MNRMDEQEVRARIERLDQQIADLELNLKLYRQGSDPWLRIQKAKEQLEANRQNLKAMLEHGT